MKENQITMYILATDYDGTLNRGGVSQRNRDAIERFRRAGNLFGVVTGRDYFMYHSLKHDNVEFDFVLPFNGGMAVNQTGEIILEHRARNRDGVIRGIAEIAGQYGYPVGCVIGKVRHTFHGAYPDGNKNCLPLDYSGAVPEFTMLNTRAKTSEAAAECTARINERYGHIVNALHNGVCIDIPPRGIDKGEGVARFAASVGVPADNIYCAGDEMNDMAMITRFHGCAVENARQEIKDAAEGVYADIAEIIGMILEKSQNP